jgi:hypothetical protein
MSPDEDFYLDEYDGEHWYWISDKETSWQMNKDEAESRLKLIHQQGLFKSALLEKV